MLAERPATADAPRHAPDGPARPATAALACGLAAAVSAAEAMAPPPRDVALSAMAPSGKAVTGEEFVLQHPDVRRGWIDTALCQDILTKKIRILVSVDGSERSIAALAFVTDGFMQGDKLATVQVVHIYSETKTYLPYECQHGPLKSKCEALLTCSVPTQRYELNWVEKDETSSDSTWHYICQAVCDLPANYICMGWTGIKGKKEEEFEIIGQKLSSNVFHVLNMGKSCGVILIKDEVAAALPVRSRPATYVVSVVLGRPSTKVFLDVLRVSKPGDTVHVVHVKSPSDPAYGARVEALYGTLCRWVHEGSHSAFGGFSNRHVEFHMPTKQVGETTHEAVVRIADELGADFVAVGANAADRVARGKPPVGTVSLKICLHTRRNVIVASWIDVSPRIYEECIRRALAPQ